MPDGPPLAVAGGLAWVAVDVAADRADLGRTALLLEGGPAERAEALHAWLVEDLPGGRVRILTQETQIGQPAAALAAMRPNPVLNGHQAWLDGLVEAARR